MGIKRNNGDSNLLDFVLEGQTNGWVAIGFSKTTSMVGHMMLFYILEGRSWVVIGGKRGRGEEGGGGGEEGGGEEGRREGEEGRREGKGRGKHVVKVCKI